MNIYNFWFTQDTGRAFSSFLLQGLSIMIAYTLLFNITVPQSTNQCLAWTLLPRCVTALDQAHLPSPRLNTTHDLSDVEKLCKHLTVIDHGKLRYYVKLDILRERFGEKRQLIVDIPEEFESILIDGAVIADREGSRITVHFTGQDFTTSALINRISAQYHIRDLEVRNPDFEATIRRIHEECLLEKLP